MTDGYIAELRRIEEALWRPETRLSPEWMDGVLAEDFVEFGASGRIHDRFKCKGYFMGECCHYGNSDALDIVIKLLIDRNVASLGHRRVCFGDYTALGVSIRPHTTYGKNAVLDFE